MTTSKEMKDSYGNITSFPLLQPYKNEWSCLDFRLFYDPDLVFGYMEIL